MEPIMCQICKKKAANVHVTEILEGGERNVVHMCEDCAREKKLGLPASITIPEILSSLINFYSEKEKTKLSDQTTCPRCGLTYAEFRSKGRLGCSQDFTVFRKALVPLLQRVHQGTCHKGKMPVPASEPASSRMLELARLRRQLDEAVQKEEYERAAQLRDRIHQLTEEQENGP